MTGLSARFPYSQSDVVRVTGASMPQVKKLSKKLLRKKGQGSGKHLGFSLDDTLRIAVARELLRVGVEVASMHELFEMIERPAVRTGHNWAWLRTAECRQHGAAIVLVLPPRNAAVTVGGRVYLTTRNEAVAWLESKQVVIVIDVGAIINELEEQTGELYVEKGSSASVANNREA